MLQALHEHVDPHLQDAPQHDEVMFETEMDTPVFAFEFSSFPCILISL